MSNGTPHGAITLQKRAPRVTISRSRVRDRRALAAGKPNVERVRTAQLPSDGNRSRCPCGSGADGDDLVGGIVRRSTMRTSSAGRSRDARALRSPRRRRMMERGPCPRRSESGPCVREKRHRRAPGGVERRLPRLHRGQSALLDPVESIASERRCGGHLRLRRPRDDLIDKGLGLRLRHHAALRPSLRDPNGDDRRGGFPVTQDEDALAPMLRSVDELGKVGFGLDEGGPLHVASMVDMLGRCKQAARRRAPSIALKPSRTRTYTETTEPRLSRAKRAKSDGLRSRRSEVRILCGAPSTPEA